MDSGIYKITSPTGRIYIGQSVNIEKRFAWYNKLHCKSQVKLYRSFLKYGVGEHSFEVIELCERELLSKRERYWQEHYACIGANGLNCQLTTSMNAPGVRSQETKDKIRNTQTGRKLSDQWRKNQSEGRKNIIFSKEHCENISLSKIGANNKRARPIIDTVTKEEFQTIAEAANKNKIDHRTLAKYLNGTRTNKTKLAYL